MTSNPCTLRAALMERIADLVPPACLHYADDTDFIALRDYVSELAHVVNEHVVALGRYAAENAKGYNVETYQFTEFVNPVVVENIGSELMFAAQRYRAEHARDAEQRRMAEERV